MIIWPEKAKHIPGCELYGQGMCTCGADYANDMLEKCKQAVAKAGETNLVPLDEESLFELISVFNTKNPDRFYDPKAMQEDRQLAIDICEKFGQQEKQELDEDKINKAILECISDTLVCSQWPEPRKIAKYICKRFSAPSCGRYGMEKTCSLCGMKASKCTCGNEVYWREDAK